ncbi:SpoIIE family protein phosphatase [Streptacidiphilus albus]|uniref:SpoIIE family protein phosphatase n=1 Tax=Streptacidiphilus albus TaxID=105425 RepID=UPI00054C4B46|nr:SpoIIE family protein phosphatase [Streptacidiphilus albus]
MANAWDSVGSADYGNGRAATGGSPGSALRPPILASWERCRQQGLDGRLAELPYLPDLDSEEQLLLASGPVVERLHSALAGTRQNVLLTDGSARVLMRRTAEASHSRGLDAVQLAPGFSYAEGVAGTNAIGTVLMEKRPCNVLGSEHFVDRLKSFTCSAAPIRDRITGAIRGVVDLTCLHRDSNPMMSALVREAAAAIEQRLFDQYGRREQELLESFLLAGGVGRGQARLGRGDLERLRDRAAELVARARADVVEVPLSHGRRAVLVCRPVDGPEGRTVLAVEANLGDGGTGRLRFGGALHPDAVGDSMREKLREPVREPVPESRRQAGRLLMFGDPAVSRHAVAARQRLALLCDAGLNIGTTLDMWVTAEEFTAAVVPRFTQYATVDLAAWVLDGDETAPAAALKLRRGAERTLHDAEGDPPHPTGQTVHYPPESPQLRCLRHERPVLDGELTDSRTDGPGRPGQGMRSALALPILARGAVLGVVTLYRCREAGPFHEDDLALAEELVARAALCLDNARRYAREHTLALTLQRSLLPRALPEQNAVEVAHRYLPAQESVGGDWYDVIPLSGGRVALVVGDVVGHGIHAAATMGRLRTAVRNFSALDLPADELLGHLDALVDSMDQEETDDHGHTGIIGATCLYVIYNPVTEYCTMASAGHLPPAVITGDGLVAFPDVHAGPPLGLGGSTFDAVEFALPADSRIVLYTDGLIEDRRQDIEAGLARLAVSLAGPRRSPEKLCEAVIRELLPEPSGDDVAVLVARARATDRRSLARWVVPIEPSAVAAVRAAATRQLLAWGLDDAVFTTELLVSELVTNAIRHATGPVELRLLRDRTLICEVADGSSVSPRLRRARMTDEGGRGLFLVAQLAQRWGTRYTSTGKVIWAEQPLPGPGPRPSA